MEITFNIPNEKIGKIKTAFLALFPIPRDEDGTPLHDENEHPKWVIKEFVKTQVVKYDTAVLKRNATQNYVPDNDIIA